MTTPLSGAESPSRDASLSGAEPPARVAPISGAEPPTGSMPISGTEPPTGDTPINGAEPSTGAKPLSGAELKTNCVRKKRRKTTGILSFDGGGSKGVMEVVVLDVVFRMATLIKEKPKVMHR